MPIENPLPWALEPSILLGIMKILSRTLFLAIALSLFAATGQSAILKFGGPIDGTQAGTDSTAIGAAILLLDTETNTFDLTINISGLANALTDSHIHRAPVGLNGPSIVDIGNASAYDVMGEFYSYSAAGIAFPPEELVNLMAGGTYLNFAEGEVRGQLLPMEMGRDALVNFSTRGMVNPGNGKAALLIGGLVIQKPKTILFRMVADSLTRFGVQTGLKDTSFEVFNQQTGELLDSNDNWKEGGQQFQIAMTGFAPAFDNESALIMTLDAPAIYTFHADSEQGAGIALIESYGIEMQSIASSIANAANGELNREFTLLSNALLKTGLGGLLNGPGPFTLFAPTDEAFLELYTEDDLNALDDAGIEILKDILLMHIVGGEVSAGDVNVVEANIMATNGVIHVIDALISP